MLTLYIYNESLCMLTKNRQIVFVIEKLGSAIWRTLTLHTFSVSRTQCN
jgi:hypothetical protein